jgi:hypothetical protein
MWREAKNMHASGGNCIYGAKLKDYVGFSVV